MKVSPNTLRISIATAIILATIGWLAFTGYGANKSYYVTIAELGGMGDKAYHSHLRVEGFVQPGSIEQNGTHVDFVLNEYESHYSEGPAGQAAEGQLQGLGTASGHLQGRLAGAGRRHLRSRWRLPRHDSAGQMRQQVRPGATRRDTGTGGRKAGHSFQRGSSFTRPRPPQTDGNDRLRYRARPNNPVRAARSSFQALWQLRGAAPGLSRS